MHMQNAQRASNWAETARSAPLARLTGLVLAVGAAMNVATPSQGRAAEGCDPAGSFATRIELPVSWRGNTALKGGRGTATYLALVSRTARAGAFGHVDETTTLCRTVQPATQTLGLWGGERFAVTYDDQQLAELGAPASTVGFFSQDDAGGGLPNYISEPTALEVGVRLPGGAKAAWPTTLASLEPLLVASPQASSGGAMAHSRTDGGYSLPPVDYSRSRRADVLMVASRAVVSMEAQWRGCDALEGQAELAEVAGQPGLDSLLVGCHTTDGGHCSASDLSLTNAFQPRMRVSGAGSYEAARLANGATCADVLAHFER